MRQLLGTLLLLGVVATAAVSEPPLHSDGKWRPLFDGKTLNGWTKPFDWGEAWVEGGEIRLRGNRKFFLVYEEVFHDFELVVEVNVPVGGNSGIQFRSHYRKNRLWGYQAEVDTSPRRWAGGLYDEGRRGWLVPLRDAPEKQKAFRNNSWNTYRIRAVGPRIQIWVNGIQTVDFVDQDTKNRDLDGYIALQHHGERGLIYRFKNIRIRIIDSPGTVEQ